MKNLSTISLVLLLAFCAIAARRKYDSRYLIGLWAQSHDGRNAIILRRADGTYREKAYQEYNVTKPPFYYESTGRWKIRGDQYIITVASWSAELYKETVGRTIKRDVLQVDKQLFKYVSPDNADEEENKIGEASDAGFEKAFLGPLPPNGYNAPLTPQRPSPSPDFMRKVQKAEPVNTPPTQ